MKYAVEIKSLGTYRTVLTSITFEFDSKEHTEMEILKIQNKAIEAILMDSTAFINNTEENLKSITDEY